MRISIRGECILIGELMGNRYEIVEQLGGGGMAIVYKGRDTILNRLVTIKVLRPEFTSDEDFVKRFRREAQAVASLSHPNIVSIYDVGRSDTVDYLVMEYIEGDNLKNLVRQHGSLTPNKAAQIAGQISEALEHAHENDIVHRDVKPQNILITKDGRAKLTDFGIARGATSATLTQTDAVMGSVHYLSPEQARGENTGPRSDIYSLGIVLYEMVTGALPFQGDTPVSVALKHIQDEAAPPASLNPAVPLSLEKIISRAMSKEPDKRYETARQMTQELETVFGAAPQDLVRVENDDEFATMVIPTVRGETGEDLPAVRETPQKKRSLGWIWALIFVLGLCAAGVWGFYFWFNVKEVVVPSVEGKPLLEAQQILTEQRIKFTTEDEPHPTVAKGFVIAQDPKAESKIKINRTVTLAVSTGPEMTTVPAVTGKKLDEAKNELEKAGLSVTEPVEYAYNENYADGAVCEQNPAGYSDIAKGSSVALVISRGRQPIVVPELAGLTEEQAKAKLAELKLELAVINRDARNNDYLSGQVTHQAPEEGNEVVENSQVTVMLNRVKETPVRYTFYDDEEHAVRIVVTDQNGTRTVLDRTIVKRVNENIAYYGKGMLQVFVDDSSLPGVELE